jgi:hypothetical protein
MRRSLKAQESERLPDIGKKMTCAVVIYFAPHFPTFTNPILSSKFRTFLEASDVCVLEWTDKWTKYEPELESLFNQLSRGERTWVKSRRLGRGLNAFDRELQNALRGRNRRIVLERSPVEYVFIQEGDVIALAQSSLLNEAVSLYKRQLMLLARNLVDREHALIKIIKELRTGKRLFVLRGADHERYLRNLLDREKISAECSTYEEPPLLRRLINSLTMGERIDDVDVQRVIYAMLHRRKGDYIEFVSLQKDAEAMTEAEVEARLSQPLDN